MAFQIQEDQEEELAEINMIPLIDVMLVLLIVFMVAAPLSISGVNVNLPKSSAKGKAVKEDQLVLSVDAVGDFYIGKVKIPANELKNRIRTIMTSRDSKDLFIRADKQVKYEKVVDAMSAAKLAGAARVGMLTETRGKG